ncbi:MAG TPA: hypothetical protein VFU36_16765 [Jatrophihabitans sp.]|nr:hypothetical protein [Jatrophihabitans sp.]
MAAAGVETRRPSPRPSPSTATGQGPSTATGQGPSTATGSSATDADRSPTQAGVPPQAGADRSPAEAGEAAGEWQTAERSTAEPGTTRAVPRSPLWLAVLLGVLVLTGVAAVVVAARLPSQSGSGRERDKALAAAKSEVPLILSYNYASFDADVAKAKAQLTGRAVTDYTTAMSQTIKPAAVKVKAVVQAQTDGAGVESVSPDGRQVTVVVFGEQKVTNTSLSAPRTDLFRVRATLDLVGGTWLVSKFDQI